MKLALLADLHANLAAVGACLAHASALGAEDYAFLGDLVGYGPEPDEVLDLVAAHASRGALVVGGNHDAAVVDGRTDTMDRAAAAAVEWTRRRLSDRGRAFLTGLPLVARRDDALFVHASAYEPAAWTYVSDPLRAAESLAAGGATWVFCGHVHVPALYHATAGGRAAHFTPVPGIAIPIPPRRRWLAVVGSAGQPRDGNPAACYALFDAAAATLTFHRVPYDVSAEAARVRAAGLPERLARRLEHGK
jgi:diadenosine tetraphosphatase ApaH/serine/threonine PP2A family protein phosphatase